MFLCLKKCVQRLFCYSVIVFFTIMLFKAWPTGVIFIRRTILIFLFGKLANFYVVNIFAERLVYVTNKSCQTPS